MLKDMFEQWVYNEKRIIVLEGPDGVGKTTQANRLFEYFNHLGIPTTSARQPHTFRNTMFSDKVTEEEKIALSLMDYSVVVGEFLESDFHLMILDRISHVSIEVYNLPHVQEKNRAMYQSIVRQHFMDSYMPDIMFNFNKLSFRPPDNSFFEKRDSNQEVYERYENNTIVDVYGYVMYEPDIQFIKLYGPGGMPDNATENTVFDFIMSEITMMVGNYTLS